MIYFILCIYSELVVSSLLSPLDQDVSNYGECGGCQDQNAACITAGDETTCWCRSGYQKRSNKCGMLILINIVDLKNMFLFSH